MAQAAAFDGLHQDRAARRGMRGSDARVGDAPTGNYYSVLFETKLRPTSYPGISRPAHYQEANEALLPDRR